MQRLAKKASKPVEFSFLLIKVLGIHTKAVVNAKAHGIAVAQVMSGFISWPVDVTDITRFVWYVILCYFASILVSY